MKARCVCPTHGRLSLDDIIIKNGMPVCRKCFAILEFGEVKPRRLKGIKPKRRRRRKRKE